MSYSFWKRTIDILALGVLLPPTAVLMAGVAFTIRACQGRPVLFRQERAGKNGRIFTLLKFRTMRNAADRRGRPLPDEKRLTRLGAWIRRLSLDELPQLWNVLRGEMSLIGPRPLPVKYLPLYSAEQNRRHLVKPGITGWAQVNGRNAIDWDEKFRLDVWYVDHLSPATDLRILWKTILTVLLPSGIGHGDHPTMHEFLGDTSIEESVDPSHSETDETTDRRAA